MRDRFNLGQAASPLAWIGLLTAMAASAAWLLDAGRGMTFSGDEVFYYARYVAHGVEPVTTGGLEYFLAPHNGHLVLLGKLVYRVLLLLFGSDYLAFRVVEVGSVLLCVGLFFVLVRRRLGPVAALIPSVLLLFFGYAYETLLWPFDVHTTMALALGLAALLAFEREDSTGDRLTCIFLVLGTAALELGLAFCVGFAVAILQRPDRRRRAWIFAVPIVLYLVWWLWARHFDQSDASLVNVHLIVVDFTDSLSAVVGSIFGLNPTGVGSSAQLTGVTAWGTLLAGIGVALLAWRVRRGDLPPTFWIPIVTLLAYWTTIAIGGRDPESSRYILVGAVLVFLIAAEALRGIRITPWALTAAACLMALAIPPNLAKFYDGRRLFYNDASATRTEYGMVQLAREEVDPRYTPGIDPNVTGLGGGVGAALSAGEYFRAAREFGPLAYSPAEVRDETLQMRQVADATLIDALGVKLRSASPPAEPTACPRWNRGRPGRPVFFHISAGRLLLGSRSETPVTVSLVRFGTGGAGFEIGSLEPGGWARISIPPDAAADPWLVLVDGPVYSCGT